MSHGLTVAYFGSSLLTSYWNGIAQYHRGIVRALARRGHRVTFYEPDAFDRDRHRDLDGPDWARVVVYPAHGEDGVWRAIEEARGSDLIVKTTGIGVFDGLLESAVLLARTGNSRVVFWDLDPPATFDRVRRDRTDPLRSLIERYDLVVTRGGGEEAARAYRALGARAWVSIDAALDPMTHHPARRDPRFAADLAFMGHRLPQRERRTDEFFFGAAGLLPRHRFLLAGAGWEDRGRPANVRHVGHLALCDHNTFCSSPRAVLHVSREGGRSGHGPSPRIFEAAGAGACIISDGGEDIDRFLEPDREVLVARDGREVSDLLRELTVERGQEVGAAARQRMLAEHTYDHRALQLEQALGIRAKVLSTPLSSSQRAVGDA